MMPKAFRWITGAFIAALLIVAGLALHSSAVSAQESAPIPSALVIHEMEPVTIRDRLVITAQLTDALGEPVGAVSNEALELFIDGEKVRRVRTEQDGTATFKVQEELPAGDYEVQVLYFGSKSLLPSGDTAVITIEPAEIEIATVPPIEGVKFTIDGHEFTSNEMGIARTTVDQLGTYKLEVLPRDTSNRLLKFNRWHDEVFDPYREVDVKRAATFEVGFDVSYLVNTAFIDLQGLVVAPERISSVVLRSSHGTESVLKAPDIGTRETGGVWLQAGRVVRRFHGLEETPIIWSVEHVEIDGTSVVNRAQQRFFVKEDDEWSIELLLYSARFSARDALFGFPLGAGVNLEFPNGQTEVISFEDANEIIVESLPRGEYRVNVAGAPGYSPYSPVALSRNQDVNLLVISYIDMGVAVALLGLLSIGLIFIGRPVLLKHLRVPGGSHSHRRAFLVMAALTLVTGVGILSVGLGHEPASSHSNTSKPATLNLERRAAAPPPFTTGDPDDVSASTRGTTVANHISDEQRMMLENQPEIPIAGVFQTFWEQNGALAVFGTPTDRPIKQADSETGLESVTQQFEHYTLEYHPELSGTPQEIQLSNRGAQSAEQLGLSSTPAFDPVPVGSPPGEDCRYYSNTGHFVCGPFLSYWSSHGLNPGEREVTVEESLALFGEPISEEFVDPETGRTVQYFERVRLELHPEHSGTPHEIQLGDLKGART